MSLKSILSMILGRKRSDNTEEDFNGSQQSSTALEGHTDAGPTLPARLQISDAESENLNMFRLLTGITSHPSFSPAAVTPTGRRPAPNLGIYARVIHNEMHAKVGYKRFNILINGCLGLQIIVAAALTAMGAGNASHSAVTTFGAINTVIAGILTFLKGSGLPSRLKYYQNEWRKVREFIEQRERDFSRPGCQLDPFRVVATIETMYEEVKLDTEANTPDRYAGIGNPRTMANMKPDRTIDYPRSAMMSTKDLEAGFGNRVHDFESSFRGKAQDTAKDLEAGFNEKVHDAQSAFSGRASGMSGRASEVQSGFGAKVRELESFGNKLKDLASEIGHKAKDTAHDAEMQGRSIAREAESVEEHAKRMANQGLALHVDSSISANEKADTRPSGS